MSVAHVWAAEIVKSERDEAGDLIVYGKATGPDLDLDQQIADPDWLKRAMPEWMQWGNLREMHQPIVAGIGLELDGIGDDWWLKSRVVDESTAKKIEAGALKGYSIGIKNAKVVRDALAPGGRINGGSIVEVSYVDRPCNPTAKTMIVKSLSGAGAGDLRPVEAVEDESSVAPDDTAVADDGGAVEQPSPVVGSALASDEGSSGAAITNPVPADQPVVEPVTPPGDDSAKSVGRDVLRRVRRLVPSLLTKAAPAEDIASAQECIAAIGRLIAEEAQDLAAGNGSSGQVRTLLDAVCALEWFCDMESREPVPDADAAKDAPAIALDAISDTTMAAEADLAKSVTPGPAVLDQSTVTEMIDKAVTEAGKASEERVKALEAELAKVNARPIPGGPVLARPVQSIAAAEERTSALAKAVQFETMAADLGSVDPATAQGYRTMAASLRSQAA
jgi:hypothetical protein